LDISNFSNRFSLDLVLKLQMYQRLLLIPGLLTFILWNSINSKQLQKFRYATRSKLIY